MRNAEGAEVPGSYTAEIHRMHPGCLLFLVDQSGSMNDTFAESPEIRKADAAADAINNLLMNIIIQCTQNFGEGPRDYFDVGVIGYGSNSGVGSCFRGGLRGRTLVSLSDLAANTLRIDARSMQVADSTGEMVETVVRFPVWLDPVAEGGVPMRDAMHLAGTLLDSWVAQHAMSYPPIIINITGGKADTDPIAAAGRLGAIRTSDGSVLFYNVYLSSHATSPIMFPNSSQDLPDYAARTLFEMTSVIPRRIARALVQEGYAVMPGARGFISNADATTLFSLLDMGTRVTPDDPSSEFGGEQVKLFISYSHRDDRYREQLATHLSVLRWQGVITDWHDRKIIPGKEWRDEIDDNLDSADCVLLLVSPDFLASGYCYSIEMQRAMKKHREGRVLLIPIIVRPADWRHTPLGDFEVLPKDAKPVIEWARRDRAWLNVTEGIRRALGRD